MKNNEIAFKNQIFDTILKKDNESLSNELLIDKKIFRVYLNDNEADKDHDEHSSNFRSHSNAKSIKSEVE